MALIPFYRLRPFHSAAVAVETVKSQAVAVGVEAVDSPLEAALLVGVVTVG
jgi:hypothetical protein